MKNKSKVLVTYMTPHFCEEFKMNGAASDWGFNIPKLPPRWHFKNENHPIKVRITIEEIE